MLIERLSRRTISFGLIAATIFLFPGLSLCAQEPGYDQTELDTKNTLHLGKEPLFLIHRTDLEQELISLEFIFKSSSFKPGDKIPVRCMEVFEIRREGFKVENNFITLAAVDLDDAPVWRSAYDCSSKRVYHLAGFPDDDSGISNLSKELDLKPSSESDALTLASDFLKLTTPESTHTLVRDKLSLMAAFMADYQGSRNWKAFSTAWNKCPPDVRGLIASPLAAAVPEGYRLTFFTYAKKKIKRISLLLTRGGVLSSIESKPLFDWAD